MSRWPPISTRVVRYRDLVEVPWKNGGGTTAEVAVWPEGAGFDEFDWRISMALVGADGPFSLFSGVDRTLMLLDGEGMDLALGDAFCRLDVFTPMITFTGEVPATAHLLSGPMRDLNVMTRRTRCDHAMEVLPPGTVALPSGSEQLVAVVVLDGSARVEIDGHAIVMDRFDTALCSSARQISADQRAVLIRIWSTSGI